MTLGELYDIIAHEKPEGMSIDKWFAMPVMVGHDKTTLRELNWDGVGMVEANVTIEGNEGTIPEVPMLIFAISAGGDIIEDDGTFSDFDPQLN